ncbi:MAG: LytR C-terminal domain-containing protein [Jatrophihabitantaceae bacterium]
MTSATKRRPLPALVFLLALCLLTALVWWRVLHRDAGHAQTKPTCPTTQAPKQLPEPQAISVTVLNSTTRNGIAGTARRLLISDGFQIPAAAANDEKPLGYHGVLPGVGEIRYGPTATDGAKLLTYYLPGAKLVATKSTDSTVVVSLGLKYKTVTTSANVTKALKADGITLTRTVGGVTSSSSSASC